MSQGNVRIVLVGRTGAGKSASGNTILGKKRFHSEMSADPVTKHCSSVSQIINRRQVLVVDTPGLFDTLTSNEEVINEIVNCITLATPGPHVFLLVMSIGRFTAEVRDTVVLIQSVFGKDVYKYMMVLFTKAGDLERYRTIENYVDQSGPELKQVISACGGRYHAFNNKEKYDRTQVHQLMRKIRQMQIQNENSYYSYYMLLTSNEQDEDEHDTTIDGLRREIRALRRQAKKRSNCAIL